MSAVIPHLITSELFYCPGIQAVLDGSRLPFAARSLRGIVMTNVLHHLPRPRLFFAEAARCVRPGGVVAMIEPWVSSWSRFVYGRLHTNLSSLRARRGNSQPVVLYPVRMTRFPG